MDAGTTFVHERKHGQVEVLRKRRRPDIMRVDGAHDEAHGPPGQTEHESSHQRLLLCREGEESPLIVPARKADHHSAPGPYEHADPQAFENFALLPDRDVHTCDVGPIDCRDSTGILELDDEFLSRGPLNSADCLIQSERWRGDADSTARFD
mgnify:CR=1 FL=1